MQILHFVQNDIRRNPSRAGASPGEGPLRVPRRLRRRFPFHPVLADPAGAVALISASRAPRKSTSNE